MQIFSFSPFGYEGALVSVEVDLRRGIPAIDIVGLADGAVKESRERMASAIRNSGFDFPPERVLISLSPADLRKEGAGFDLAVALAVLYAKKVLDAGIDCNKTEKNGNLTDSILVMGELELNGKVRPVRGVHAAAGTAFAGGIGMCIVPAANADEAKEITGMKVFGAENLQEAFNALGKSEVFSSKPSLKEKDSTLPEGSLCIKGVWFPAVEGEYEYGEIRNQKRLVRGLQLAAAGGHNLLAFGPPGCGKTMALQKFPSLLPLLTKEEAQSVTRIHSIAGLLSPSMPLVRKAPFRQPHQTASIEGICGGGIKCSPGEISLAHNGVLFLDEAAEFRTSVLQMLRVPLESHSITLSRAGRTTVYPASFQLLMATNPCPCGNYGSRDKLCLCSSRAVEQYWKKFSAPLLDRIDLRIQVEASGDGTENVNKEAATTSQLREKIGAAVAIERKRQGKRNVFLTPSEITSYCIMTSEARKVLERETEKLNLSPRAVAGSIKLSRTIADMEEKEMIDAEDVMEAVDFRKPQGGMCDTGLL